ncbi:MAG: SDR family NAD(P)-dependent oxidoreductase [Actinobacteria bacterium]|nr:SDR family NAD(P)-dependent oxidoreductase [Actinomycetota bacterium]
MVTGAAGGIGRAVVSVLAASGHQVTAVGRELPGLQALPASRAIAADFSQPQKLAEAVQEPERLDALVHCAGVSVRAMAPVSGTGTAVWQETMAVNAMAAAELTRLVLPALRRSRGHVVFVNAAPGVRAVPRWPAFAASKAALRELADSLRLEEAAHGLRVTTLYPGGTATAQLREVRAAAGRDYDPRRLIRPETLAAMVAWVLAAPPDAYVSEFSVLATPRPA